MENFEINAVHFGLMTGLLNGFGAILKAVPSIENHWIPFALVVVGGLGHAMLAGWTGPNVIVGVIAAFSATGVHQIAQQAKASVAK